VVVKWTQGEVKSLVEGEGRRERDLSKWEVISLGMAKQARGNGGTWGHKSFEGLVKVRKKLRGEDYFNLARRRSRKYKTGGKPVYSNPPFTGGRQIRLGRLEKLKT